VDGNTIIGNVKSYAMRGICKNEAVSGQINDYGAAFRGIATAASTAGSAKITNRAWRSSCAKAGVNRPAACRC
jgi:hypothetical protein